MQQVLLAPLIVQDSIEMRHHCIAMILVSSVLGILSEFVFISKKLDFVFKTYVLSAEILNSRKCLRGMSLDYFEKIDGVADLIGGRSNGKSCGGGLLRRVEGGLEIGE